MIVTKRIEKVRSVSRSNRCRGKTVGFVPTMGSLHVGHLSLVRKARKDCGFVAVSIFVNPLQFSPGEDYARYPRDLRKDRRLLEEAGVDMLFCPDESVMYAPGASVTVEERDLSRFLCGASRPGHFKGVCTVLVKLFNIVEPEAAYFGQKDYQQAKIAERLVRDLDFPIKVKILPIIREDDNLAMSSRNLYLREAARGKSVCVYNALRLAKQLIEKKRAKQTKGIIRAVKKVISRNPSVEIDYIKIVDPRTLAELKTVKGKALVAAAVYVDGVRLIDNMLVNTKKRFKKRG